MEDSNGFSGRLALPRLTGFESQALRQLLLAREIMAKTGHVSLRSVLPLLFNLKGAPLTIKDHFVFEPFYRTRMPKRMVARTGRQVAKSSSLAIQAILHCLCVPHLSILFVAPLFEQIRKFSQNYISPLVQNSPIKPMLLGDLARQSVLERHFGNQSKMQFGFTGLDPSRLRGISTDVIDYDEVQDLDPDHIGVINEAQSYSKWEIRRFTGTPKTFENGLEGFWQESSMAEWGIRCDACNKWNIPAREFDLERMLGPWHPEISEARPGVVCAKCNRPIFPRTGRWIHRYPERKHDFLGIHVPQIIMPLHYASPDKWRTLLAKREGAGNMQINEFFNEILGEAYDSGAKLVSQSELKRAACLPWKNTISEARPQIGKYRYIVLGADWGGGGEKGDSYTTLAVAGMNHDYTIDVLWGMRSLRPHEHVAEAELVLRALNAFKCICLCHDYGGAGALRETFISHAGFPYKSIMPFQYIRAGRGNIMQWKPPKRTHPRGYFTIDKTRSLVTICQLIKMQHIKFFEWDYQSVEQKGLLYDFLALVEDKMGWRFGSDVYTIIRTPSMTDDFAHAVNYACLGLWKLSGRWPNLAVLKKYELSKETINAAIPKLKTWDQISGMAGEELMGGFLS